MSGLSIGGAYGSISIWPGQKQFTLDKNHRKIATLLIEITVPSVFRNFGALSFVLG